MTEERATVVAELVKRLLLAGWVSVSVGAAQGGARLRFVVGRDGLREDQAVIVSFDVSGRILASMTPAELAGFVAQRTAEGSRQALTQAAAARRVN